MKSSLKPLWHPAAWSEGAIMISSDSFCLHSEASFDAICGKCMQMYVTAKCTCLVLVRKKTQKQTHVHHCDCTARSNDSK